MSRFDCTVQMSLYQGVTCLKQPIFVLPVGDPLGQVWLYIGSILFESVLMRGHSVFSIRQL